MKVRVTMCISLIFAVLTFTGQSIAEIDPQTLAGLWLFDEGQGDVAGDSSGNGLDGEFTGGPKWVDGRFGKALEFDGASYVTIPDHVNPTAAITISAWVKSAAATWNENGWIVEKRDAYIIHPNGGSTNVAFCVVNGAPWNQPNSWDTGAVGPDDITEWHMYTCTYDSSTGEWKIYIDGEVASSLDLDKVELAEDAGPVHIGWDDCCGGARFGQGIIDEVAVFNVALGQDDIQAIMNNGLGPSVLAAVEPADKLATTWGEMKASL
jgi:hypothetical protein